MAGSRPSAGPAMTLKGTNDPTQRNHKRLYLARYSDLKFLNADAAKLTQDCVQAAGPAGRKAMASISIFALSNRPATCTAVLVGGSFGKNSPRMREYTA